jgi:predicted deacylase
VSISDYAENKLVDAVVNHTTTGGGLPTADIWVKLHTGDPGENGTSNAATETTRKQASFAAASGGSAATDADVPWTSVAGTETYSHVSFWDASTAGNCLGSGAMGASKAVNAGDNFTLTSGNVTFAID